MIDIPPQPPQRQEQVIERKLVDCGLDAKGLSVKYEDYLQSIEVVISPAAGASKASFDCIRQAAGHEIVTFADNEMRAEYDAFLAELYRPQMIAEATKSAKELGLLPNFPRRRSFANLAEYARALERHAGVTAGSALKVSGDALAFDPPRELNYNKFSKLYSKLLAATMYAVAIGDLEKMGFIGNEALSADENDGQDHPQ